jgi:4-hydroxybenzoate polyprenyltransferase
VSAVWAVIIVAIIAAVGVPCALAGFALNRWVQRQADRRLVRKVERRRDDRD